MPLELTPTVTSIVYTLTFSRSVTFVPRTSHHALGSQEALNRKDVWYAKMSTFTLLLNTKVSRYPLDIRCFETKHINVSKTRTAYLRIGSVHGLWSVLEVIQLVTDVVPKKSTSSLGCSLSPLSWKFLSQLTTQLSTRQIAVGKVINFKYPHFNQRQNDHLAKGNQCSCPIPTEIK